MSADFAKKAQIKSSSAAPDGKRVAESAPTRESCAGAGGPGRGDSIAHFAGRRYSEASAEEVRCHVGRGVCELGAAVKSDDSKVPAAIQRVQAAVAATCDILEAVDGAGESWRAAGVVLVRTVGDLVLCVFALVGWLSAATRPASVAEPVSVLVENTSVAVRLIAERRDDTRTAFQETGTLTVLVKLGTAEYAAVLDTACLVAVGNSVAILLAGHAVTKNAATPLVKDMCASLHTAAESVMGRGKVFRPAGEAMNWLHANANALHAAIAGHAANKAAAGENDAAGTLLEVLNPRIRTAVRIPAETLAVVAGLLAALPPAAMFTRERADCLLQLLKEGPEVAGSAARSITNATAVRKPAGEAAGEAAGGAGSAGSDPVTIMVAAGGVAALSATLDTYVYDPKAANTAVDLACALRNVMAVLSGALALGLPRLVRLRDLLVSRRVSVELASAAAACLFNVLLLVAPPKSTRGGAPGGGGDGDGGAGGGEMSAAAVREVVATRAVVNALLEIVKAQTTAYVTSAKESSQSDTLTSVFALLELVRQVRDDGGVDPTSVGADAMADDVREVFSKVGRVPLTTPIWQAVMSTVSSALVTSPQ